MARKQHYFSTRALTAMAVLDDVVHIASKCCHVLWTTFAPQHACFDQEALPHCQIANANGPCIAAPHAAGCSCSTGACAMQHASRDRREKRPQHWLRPLCPCVADYLRARRAYLLRIAICGLSLPSLPGCTLKGYSAFHHDPAAHQVKPIHRSLFFSM